jgi:hypothetical protein
MKHSETATCPGLKTFEQLAGLERRVGRARLLPVVEVPNHACSVDHKSGATGEPGKKAENSVLPRDLLLHVAEQWECEPEFLSEAEVCGRFIDADSQDLSACFSEFGKTSLVCPEFLRSARRIGEDIEGQHDIALASEIAESDFPPQMIRQLKIRCLVSDD